jgi:thiol-disulfide isomerase/thioredoxin
MSKATRIRQQNARERIAAQRAAARKAEIRNRVFITGGSILAVIVVVVAFIIIKANQNSAKTGSGTSATGAALPARVIKDITAVPAATLNAIGPGSTVSKAVTSISGSALTSAGKPEVLYIGAEYCPYCATERWAMAVALSRFGIFSGLRGIYSSSTDVDPSTPTLTFYKSTYASKYLTFTPVETTTEDRNTTLQTPTAAQAKIWQKYDSAGNIPFIDFGNKYLINQVTYDPSVLKGKTWAQIASALNDKSSAIAKGADGSANVMTAAICKLTHNQPANVCTSPMITSLAGQI